MEIHSLSWRDGLIVGAASAACAASWWLPDAKETAVAGRLDYAQFVLALLTSGLLIGVVLTVLVQPTRRRLAGFRVATIALGSVAPILAWEAAACVWPTRPLMDNPWYLISDQGVEASAVLPFERPAHLHWEGLSRGDLAILNDDADPRATPVAFVTDHEGFRNSQDRTQADLLFIGDSFTEAGNLAEDHTFVQRTATALGQSTRNLGRAGYTGPSELIVLKKYGLPCRPRTVVWQCYEGNDLIEAMWFAQWTAAGRPDYFELIGRPSPRVGPYATAWQQHSPTWRLFCALREARPWPLRGTFEDRQGRAHEVRFLEMPSHIHSPAQHPGWPVLAQSLRDGARCLRAERIRLVVLHIPMSARALGTSVRLRFAAHMHVGPAWDIPEPMTLATHLHKLCDELGVSLVDGTPLLRAAAAAGDLVYLPFDTHLSAEGHGVIATALVDTLRTVRK